MERNKRNLKERGITLVALIITIIIMLILVAVTVRVVVQSDLIGIAETAGEEYKTSYEKENNSSKITVSGTDYESLEEYNQILREGSISTVIAKNEAKNTNLNKASVDKVMQTKSKSGIYEAPIPVGFTVSGLESEQDIDEGMVIYLIPEGTIVDWTNETEVANAKKTYDQFVWIPINEINDMYMCQSEDGTKSCNITVQEVDGEDVAYCTTHSSTLMAGRLYATELWESFNPSLITQTYTEGGGLREPDTVSAHDGNTTYLAQLNGILVTNYASENNFKTDLQDEYNQIVKSVYQNQGFYIGRYETSGMQNSDTNATIKVVAGSDNSTNASIGSVTWYRMYAQQKKYAENKGLTSSIGSTMIQGAAYDQVMKFIDPKTSFVKTTGRIGHTRSEFITAPYQTGGVNYSSVYSGTVEYNDVAKNIYDLEGNVQAWTTEANNTDRRVFRGGDTISSWSPSYRSRNYPFNRGSGFGTVCQLYVQ